MKIIFMGTPDFAVRSLEALIEAGHEVCAVVTQPDKEKGRNRTVQYSPVKECALAHGLAVFQPEKIRRPEAVEQLRNYQADIFVVAAFGQILSKEILEMPKFGCINIHASLLPRYRGASPIQYAVLNGDEMTGVTIQQMNEGVDTGDILTMKAIPVEKTDTGGSLFEKLSVLGAELLVKTLPRIEAGDIIPVKQQEEDAVHVHMLNKDMGRIDWEKDAHQLERLVRGMNPWPSAYCRLRGKSLKVWQSEVLEEAEKEETARIGLFKHNEEKKQPGEVLLVTKDSIHVHTGGGVLVLKEVQLEGKKRMPVKDFLLGCQVKAGEILE